MSHISNVRIRATSNKWVSEVRFEIAGESVHFQKPTEAAERIVAALNVPALAPGVPWVCLYCGKIGPLGGKCPESPEGTHAVSIANYRLSEGEPRWTLDEIYQALYDAHRAWNARNMRSLSDLLADRLRALRESI